MTPNQRLVSVLLAAHLAAVFIGAIPNLEEFAVYSPRPFSDSGSTSTLTASLDAAADEIIWLHRVAWSLTTPLRGPVYAYMRVTGQGQRWNMFSNPARVYSSARLGYRIRQAGGTTTIEYEDVYPAGPTGAVKLVRSYFDSFTDKAFAIAAETYRTTAASAQNAGHPLTGEQVLQFFQPFTRYYSRRRVARGLPPGASLVAVEFWWGTARAPAPPPAAASPNEGREQSSSITWQLWATDNLQ